MHDARSLTDPVVSNANTATPVNQTLTVDVAKDSTIAEIKARVAQRTGTPPSLMRLLFEGKQLHNEHTLAYYIISPDSTLHLMYRLVGGGIMSIDISTYAGASIKTVRFRVVLCVCVCVCVCVCACVCVFAIACSLANWSRRVCSAASNASLSRPHFAM